MTTRACPEPDCRNRIESPNAPFCRTCLHQKRDVRISTAAPGSCLCICGCTTPLTARDRHWRNTRCEACRRAKTPVCWKFTSNRHSPRAPRVPDSDISPRLIARIFERARLVQRYERAMRNLEAAS